MEPDPDVELMLALRAGDPAAFDALWARWSVRLLRYLERIVGDPGGAEELLQETFLRVYRARERYEPEARFSTWLYRIGTNLALNELRRPRRRRPHQSADGGGEDGGPSLQLVADAPAVEKTVEARIEAEKVGRELDALPERQRVALWLAAVEGHSYAEVAEVLETTPTSVKSLVHRGRATLAARLRAEPVLPASGERA